ncbi:MAG: hypothetical protein CMK59_00935 [Proteobacteria bacterium]|nr:hypothetical protein [Pseudomonadota bacterium]
MLLICSVLFFACPLPPEEGNTTSSNQQGGVQAGRVNNQGNGNKNTGGAGQTGPGGGRQFSGGGQAPQGQAQQGGLKPGQPGQGGAPGGVLMDISQMMPQKTQEDIQSGDAVAISGEVKGECEGAIRVDAIDTTILGAPQEGEGVPGPITAVDLDVVGAFTLYVPKGSTIQLAALCDADRDLKITEDKDKLSMGSRIGEVLEAVSGVELLLETVKPPDAGGPGEGGPGAGGPGAGGPGAGNSGAGNSGEAENKKDNAASE